MEHERYFAYDKLEIPEYIMKMTKAERRAEIARLEAEAAAEKQRILEREKKAS